MNHPTPTIDHSALQPYGCALTKLPCQNHLPNPGEAQEVLLTPLRWRKCREGSSPYCCRTGSTCARCANGEGARSHRMQRRYGTVHVNSMSDVCRTSPTLARRYTSQVPTRTSSSCQTARNPQAATRPQHPLTSTCPAHCPCRSCPALPCRTGPSRSDRRLPGPCSS